MLNEATHPDHPEIAKRLKRAEGHLRTVIDMIEKQRPCLAIAQQLHAVEKAIGTAKKALIYEHIDHCLEKSAEAPGKASRGSIEEFKSISKYL